MLGFIRTSIRKYVEFSDGFILRYNKKNKTARPYIFFAENNSSLKTEFESQIDIEYSVYDDDLTMLYSPVVQDVAVLLAAGRKEVAFIQSVGVVEFVTVRLMEGTELMGILALLSKHKNSFKPEGLTLLERISNQIAIATANIIANEEIANREQEKSILLALNNDIASQGNRDDFFKVVSDRIKKIFPVDSFGITQINEDGKTYRAFKLEDQFRTKFPAFYDRLVADTRTVSDRVYSTIMQSEEPVLFTVAELALQSNIPSYVEFWKLSGFQEVVCVALRADGEFVGAANFYSLGKSPINLKSDLLKAVCALLAVKVANIKAYEEIEEREREKSILLALSNDIASPGNPDDFFEAVISRIKTIFSVDSFAISQINEDGKTYRAFDLGDQYRAVDPVLYDKFITGTYNVSDSVYSTIMQSDDPVLFKVEELLLQPGIPPYIEFWERAGVKEVVCVALRAAGQFVGAANFYSLGKSPINLKSGLLKAVCAQLAVKVANIKAYGELEEREREKSILLSISNEIAGLKNRDDFFDVVLAQLKNIFAFDRFIITYIHEDGKTYGVFKVDEQYNIMVNNLFRSSSPEKLKMADNPIYSVGMQSDEPLLIDVDDLPPTKDMFTLTGLWRTYGVKQVLQVPLRVGGKTIAGASFHYFNKTTINVKSSLLKGVCAQLGVAVSNILANEKVLYQLAEINKYKLQLEDERTYLKEEIENAHNYTEIVGESPEIKKVFRLVTQVAYSDSTVLILGETGTGKELIARAIHNSSTRKNKLMIKVNCAALPANLIESELFGHEKGSFTGAIDKRIGKFELANNGTLFLDEIGELTADVQAKLLRALQEKEIERVGGKNTIKVDVRIIAATNRDLEKLMDEGKFRSDLYYRLNVFPITIPPLRNRREDIPQLVSYFILHYAKKAGKKINTISNSVLDELTKYDWPGNIRELEHLIERSVLLASTDTIKEVNLPRRKKSANPAIGQDDIVIKTIDENEKEHILRTLKYTKGRIGGAGGAAELLGLPTSTLNSRIKKLRIRREHFGE